MSGERAEAMLDFLVERGHFADRWDAMRCLADQATPEFEALALAAGREAAVDDPTGARMAVGRLVDYTAAIATEIMPAGPAG